MSRAAREAAGIECQLTIAELALLEEDWLLLENLWTMHLHLLPSQQVLSLQMLAGPPHHCWQRRARAEEELAESHRALCRISLTR
jgi:hypothetical protein